MQRIDPITDLSNLAETLDFSGHESDAERIRNSVDRLESEQDEQAAIGDLMVVANILAQSGHQSDAERVRRDMKILQNRLL